MKDMNHHGLTIHRFKSFILFLVVVLLGFTNGCVANPQQSLFFVSILESIKKDDNATMQSLGTTISRKVYGNDTLMVRFALTAMESDLTNIQITLESSPIDLNQWVDESHIYAMNATLASDKKDFEPSAYYDVMVETMDTTLTCGQTREYVVFIRTLSDLPTALDSLYIHVNADQFDQTKTLIIQLDPVSVALDNHGFTIELWQHPFTSARYYNVEPFGETHQQILSAMLEYYQSIGGKMMTATVVDEVWNHQSYDADPSLIQWIRQKDGSFRFDYTNFDTWVSLGLTSGVLDLNDPSSGIKAYSIAPWNNQITYMDEASGSTIKETLTVGSQPWTYYWTTFLEDFMVHCEAMGIEEHVYIAMDERDAATLKSCIDLIRGVHNSKGQSFKISAAINSDMIDQIDLLNQIEDISFSLTALNGSIKPFMALSNQRAQDGLTTTIYTTTGQYPSSFVTSDPADTLFSLLYSYRLHASGFLRWSYDGWNSDPLYCSDYGDFQSGDPFLVYPLDSMVQPYISPSYRLLLMRYGLSMIAKMDYLSSIGQTSAIHQLNQWVYPNALIDANYYATYASDFDHLLLTSNVNHLLSALQ